MPKLTWVRLMGRYEIRVIQSFGGQDGLVIEVSSSVENVQIISCLVGFPVFFQVAASRFQDLKCGSEPRIGF